MPLSFPPNVTPSDIVKNLKGSVARLWFKQHPELSTYYMVVTWVAKLFYEYHW